MGLWPLQRRLRFSSYSPNSKCAPRDAFPMDSLICTACSCGCGCKRLLQPARLLAPALRFANVTPRALVSIIGFDIYFCTSRARGKQHWLNGQGCRKQEMSPSPSSTSPSPKQRACKHGARIALFIASKIKIYFLPDLPRSALMRATLPVLAPPILSRFCF